MKIKTEIMKKVQESTKIKRELAWKLDVSDSSISRYIRDNSENGELTKIAAIKIIASKLNVSEESILVN